MFVQCFLKLIFLVYNASFVLYGILLSDIMRVIKLCINRFDNKSYSRLQFLRAGINVILRLY